VNSAAVEHNSTVHWKISMRSSKIDGSYQENSFFFLLPNTDIYNCVLPRKLTFFFLLPNTDIYNCRWTSPAATLPSSVYTCSSSHFKSRRWIQVHKFLYSPTTKSQHWPWFCLSYCEKQGPLPKIFLSIIIQILSSESG
jgi:hypothetical protein